MADRAVVVVVNTTKGTTLGDKVRVADSMLTRLVGLMANRSLPAGSGLLIIPSNGIHTLGMLFAIDVVFLDRHHRVIDLRERVRPFRITRLNWRSESVLELPADTIRMTRTGVGDELLIQPVTQHCSQSIASSGQS